MRQPKRGTVHISIGDHKGDRWYRKSCYGVLNKDGPYPYRTVRKGQWLIQLRRSNKIERSVFMSAEYENRLAGESSFKSVCLSWAWVSIDIKRSAQYLRFSEVAYSSRADTGFFVLAKRKSWKDVHVHSCARRARSALMTTRWDRRDIGCASVRLQAGRL